MIVGAHDTGPLIRSRNGFWLAIPTPAAGQALGGRRITPAAWELRTGLRLRFVYRRTGPSLLVAEAARLNARGLAAAPRSKTGRGQVTAPIFLLVPQVTCATAVACPFGSPSNSSIARLRRSRCGETLTINDRTAVPAPRW